MGETFETKIIRIGTSYGVIIPKSLLERERIKLGEKVELSVLKKQKWEELEKARGSAPWLKGFAREKGDMDRF